MDRVYTTTIGKYYTLGNIIKNINGKITGIKRIEYPLTEVKRDKTELDDLLFDYILAKADKITYFTFSDEDIKLLTEAGFDLNINNWLEVKCPYLPFVHYLYVPGSWII